VVHFSGLGVKLSVPLAAEITPFYSLPCVVNDYSID